MKQFTYNLMVIFSKLLNVILLGSPHESFSQRLGLAMRINPNKWYRPIGLFINWLFRVTLKEEDHLMDALDGENHAKEIWSWNKEVK